MATLFHHTPNIPMIQMAVVNKGDGESLWWAPLGSGQAGYATNIH